MKEITVSSIGHSVTQNPIHKTTIKDPGSSITHFIGLIMAALGNAPLLVRASRHGSPIYMISMAVFMASMILLYAASTTYHTFDISPSVLIAGSYTPVCLLVLNGRLGLIILGIVWGLAITGILIKAFWIYCPKWFSSILYIGMGWTCILAFGPIVRSLTPSAFFWLLTGGIIYTIGGVIYALKLPIFNSKHPYFGSHEIFHLFVMGGSLCHYIFMFCYLA